MCEQHQTMLLCLHEVTADCSDIRSVIMSYLARITKEIAFSVVLNRIPREIVNFKLFRRHTGQGMFIYCGATDDPEKRRRIHEYCERNGFSARTKYARVGNQLRIKCDHCDRRLDTSMDSDGEAASIHCSNCSVDDYWPCETEARFRDDRDGPKNTGWRTKYTSTGVMLIVDTRARPTPRYKNFGLEQGQSWRKHKRSRQINI